jgi:hypothetical protein
LIVKALMLGLIMLFLAASVHAQQFAAEADFLWTHAAGDDGGKVITGFIGGGTELRIPPYIQGIPVTEIAPWAFLGGALTYLALPDTVTNIGAMAFASNNLTAVSFGSNITYIGMMAFTDNALTELFFPEGLNIIGYRSFSDNNLYSVTIPASVTSIGDAAFGYALLVMPGGGAVAPEIFVVPPTIAALSIFEDPTRLWSVGLSGGLSIIEPAGARGVFVAGGTAQVTFAPWRFSFIRVGVDVLSGRHGTHGEFSSLSAYPFAQVALFWPTFGWLGGFYIGTGAGFKMTSFNDQHGQDGRENFFMMDVFTVGATFTLPALGGLAFSASYTMRTDFSALTDRVSVGVMYRFRARGM